MKKRGKTKALKGVGKEDFSRKRKERCFCTFVGFTNYVMLIFFVSFSDTFFRKNSSNLPLMILNKNYGIVSAKYGNIKEDKKRSLVIL